MVAASEPQHPAPRDDVRGYRHGSPAEREVAAIRLDVLIRTAAERVTAAVDGDTDEFVQSAPAYILEERTEAGDRRIDRYDSTRPFFPWLNTVLRNRLKDGRRSQAAARALERAAAVPDRDEPPPDPDGGWPRQIARLTAALGVGRAVEFLSVTGVCDELPADQWEDLVRGYEAERGATLADPFPPAEASGLSTVRTRTGVIAAALGLKPNTLSVRYRRAVRELREAFAQVEECAGGPLR